MSADEPLMQSTSDHGSPSDDDRSTNGARPRPDTATDLGVAGAVDTPESSASGPSPAEDGSPTRTEMTVALTPGQLAVGGVIVAGLLLVGARLIFGRRRGR